MAICAVDQLKKKVSKLLRDKNLTSRWDGLSTVELAAAIQKHLLRNKIVVYDISVQELPPTYECRYQLSWAVESGGHKETQFFCRERLGTLRWSDSAAAQTEPSARPAPPDSDETLGDSAAVSVICIDARWAVKVSEHGYTRSLGPYPSEANAKAVAEAEADRLLAGPFYETPKR
jgi:hypothetical protein